MPDDAFDIKVFLRGLTTKPGVYRMEDAAAEVIYVGKARNLKKRVSSYFSSKAQSPKTRAMLAHVKRVSVIVTRSENEALLLENNLIKELRPRYNVVLRDDKSYPYIYVTTHQEFPRLSFHRGAKRTKGRYFGPYPSAGAVRESLQLLQKIFPVRQCEDSFFKNRTRPCLQHQIKRCTAPCVGYIDVQTYKEDVRHSIMFLEGKNQEVIDELVKRMEEAAQALDFEQAAVYRDQISKVRRVQEKQYVSGSGGNIDVITAVADGGMACVQVFFIRNGSNLGNKTFFPKHTQHADAAGILAAFIPQYYLGKEVPNELIVNHALEDAPLLSRVLSEQSGHNVEISWRVRGERARWLSLAEDNAARSLSGQLRSRAGSLQRLEGLQDALSLDETPTRFECFDISHTQGEETVASCVVFEAGEPLKSDYRRFNIKDIAPGDDYAAMRQALTRRYRRLKEGEGKVPDILFIDGGKGQVNAALSVLEELQVADLRVVGIAKGEGRKAGLETLHLAVQKRSIMLPPDSGALHLVLHIRDEAHRFAITGHRQRRAKARRKSPLEDIEGLGPKRRRVLLTQFGGLQEVQRAGIEDLAQVPGISRQLAQRIYDAFHIEEN